MKKEHHVRLEEEKVGEVGLINMDRVTHFRSLFFFPQINPSCLKIFMCGGKEGLDFLVKIEFRK